MPTYFGYVEREADSYINWAEIGKGISDTVNEIDKVRNEKKAALDQVSRDFQAKLSEYPTGQDINANGFAYRYSDNASQFMLMQQRLLKQGKLKLKDYLNSTQNIMDDTENAFTLVKTYQEQYGKKMEQYRNKEISIADIDNFAFLEGFGGFVNTDLIINPLDGSVNLAKMVTKDVDGKKIRTMAEGQQNIMSVGAMKQLMNTPIPRYDTDKQSTALAKGMGDHVDMMIKDGLILSRKDITRRLYNEDVLASNDPSRIINALIDSNVDPNDFSITSTVETVDEKTKEKKTESKTERFLTEQELTKKYLQLKDMKELTESEKRFMSKMDRSLMNTQQDRDMMFEYKKAETLLIESNLGTEYNYMSALMDNNVLVSRTAAKGNKEAEGKPYQGFTYDEEEAKKNPQMILKKNDNGTVKYVLTKEQKQDAIEAIRNQIRAKLDEEEKFVNYDTRAQKEAEAEARKIEAEAKLNESKRRKPPTDAENKAYARAQGLKQDANFVANLHSGTGNEISMAISHYKNKPNIWDVKRTEEGIEVIYAKTDENNDKVPTGDSEFQSFYAEDGTPFNTDQFYNAIYPMLYPNIREDQIGQDIAEGRIYIKQRSDTPELKTFTESEEDLERQIEKLKEEMSGLGILDFEGRSNLFIKIAQLESDLNSLREKKSTRQGPLQSNAGKTGSVNKAP
jgi:hypothetical protein